VKLQAIYDTLPKINCKRLCQEYCGPVIPNACLPEEAHRLSLLPIIQTQLTNFTCGALLYGSCSIYSMRPLICRLFGCVEAMRCPHGCEPEFWLTDEEVEAILIAHGGAQWVGNLHAGANKQKKGVPKDA
jgi:uncharacterized protein